MLSNTASYATYTGNGSQQVFDVKNGSQGIYFDAASELYVTLRDGDTITPQTITTHYTVSGAGTDAGAITFLTAPGSGIEVRIERRTPLTQTLSLTAGGSFNPANVEANFDKVFRALQDQSRAGSGDASGTYDGYPLTMTADGESWDGEGYALRNLATPTLAYDAATKQYVDELVVAASTDTALAALAEIANPDDDADYVIAYDSSGAAAGKIPIYSAARGALPGRSHDIVPTTVWLEPDSWLPGIITRETSGGTISFTAQYLTEKLQALHELGFRRYIWTYLCENGRTWTEWTTTPTDPTGTAFHNWRDDVAAPYLSSVDDFDVLKHVIEVLDKLEGAKLIIGLGRHDDLYLLNDIKTVEFDAGTDPLRFGRTVTVRKAQEIDRYTQEASDLHSRFGRHRSWGGFYISHEADHIQSASSLYQPIASALRQYGEIHVSPASPIDLANTNAIADALNNWEVDWIWPQTSAGYGINWYTGSYAYVSGISIFGSAGHMSTWRDVINTALGRSESHWTPRLGGHVEAWRIGVQGGGTLSFGATSGSGVTVTLGTAGSIVSADIGKFINVRADQATGTAEIKSITDSTHVVVDIVEALADTSILAGFWSIVTSLDDIYQDAYPASATEVATEIATCAKYVDDYSVYAEVYMDPSNLSLRLKETNGQFTDFQTRARNLWSGYRKAVEHARSHGNWLGWNARGLSDPGADRVMFWDHSAGPSGEGQFGFLSMPAAGLAISGTDIALANDLAAVEGLSGTGIVVRTATDAMETRSIASGANITVTNGDGVAGNPTVAMSSTPTGIASINASPFGGFRNRLINGSMRINQRGSTSVADDTYCFDRWYVLTQTASITVGAQTNIANGWPHAIRLTQSQASAQRMGLAQIIESANCIDLRGQAVAFSARVQMSASSQTVRYAILEWTGTADAVTSDWVNNWGSGTFTAGNFFTSTSTVVVAAGSTALTANTPTSIALAGTISSSANNIAVMIWTDGEQAQNVTLDIGQVQLEPGSTATAFEVVDVATELSRCRRYYRSVPGGTFGNAEDTAIVLFGVTFAPQMLATPQLSLIDTTPTVRNAGGFSVTGTASAIASSAMTSDGGMFRINGFSGLVATYPYVLADSSTVTAAAEL